VVMSSADKAGTTLAGRDVEGCGDPALGEVTLGARGPPDDAAKEPPARGEPTMVAMEHARDSAGSQLGVGSWSAVPPMPRATGTMGRMTDAPRATEPSPITSRRWITPAMLQDVDHPFDRLFGPSARDDGPRAWVGGGALRAIGGRPGLRDPGKRIGRPDPFAERHRQKSEETLSSLDAQSGGDVWDPVDLDSRPSSPPCRAGPRTCSLAASRCHAAGLAGPRLPVGARSLEPRRPACPGRAPCRRCPLGRRLGSDTLGRMEQRVHDAADVPTVRGHRRIVVGDPRVRRRLLRRTLRE
jgi:hypothetical protein